MRGDVDRDVLRVPLGALVEEVDVGAEAHALDRRLERALGDDENGVGGRHESLELRRRRRRQARDDDRADLPGAEDGLEPVHGAARHHDDAVAGADASLAERDRPDRRALRDLAERAVLDDPVAAEEGQSAPLRVARKRLDDVAREVEAIGDLPAAVDERGAEGKLERRAGQLVPARAAPADAKTFHGLAIIDPNRPVAECESSLIVLESRAALREAELDGERLVRRKPLRKPESARLLERGDARAGSEDAC